MEEIEEGKNEGRGDDEQLLDDLHWSFPPFHYINIIFINMEKEAKLKFIQKLHVNPIIPLQNEYSFLKSIPT